MIQDVFSDSAESRHFCDFCYICDLKIARDNFLGLRHTQIRDKDNKTSPVCNITFLFVLNAQLDNTPVSGTSP